MEEKKVDTTSKGSFVFLTIEEKEEKRTKKELNRFVSKQKLMAKNSTKDKHFLVKILCLPSSEKVDNTAEFSLAVSTKIVTRKNVASKAMTSTFKATRNRRFLFSK